MNELSLPDRLIVRIFMAKVPKDMAEKIVQMKNYLWRTFLFERHNRLRGHLIMRAVLELMMWPTRNEHYCNESEDLLFLLE